MNTVFLIRCHEFDAVARALAQRIHEAGGRVVAMMDERKGLSDTAPFEKISLDDKVVDAVGLGTLPANWGWLFGDIWLYVARKELPKATHFCLLDSDVAIPPLAATRFVSEMQRLRQDLLAVGLRQKDEAPKFSRGLSALSLDPRFGCIFPVVRCSRRAVDAMRVLRQQSLAAGVGAALNDEGILAGAAQSGKLSHAALDTLLPELFAPDQFDTNPPHLAEAVWRDDSATSVLHPVVTLERILTRIGSGQKNYTRHRLRRVLRTANDSERAAVSAALGEKPAVRVKPAESEKGGPSERLAYLAAVLPLAAPIRVLDIGAKPLIEADAPYIPLLRAGLAEVFGFEPQDEALAALNARKSDRETYFPYALGDGASGKLRLYRSQGFASLHAIDPDSARLLGFERGTELVGEIEVQTRRLDDLDEVPAVDLLKIDVQGAGSQIIANGRAKLGGLLAAITEVRLFPLYQGEPRFGVLEGELTGLGLEFLKFATLKSVPLTRRNRAALRRSDHAQVVDGDAVFVRDLRRLDRMDAETLKRLAMIAESVLDSIDLVLAVLEELEDRFALPPSVVKGYLALLQAAGRTK